MKVYRFKCKDCGAKSYEKIDDKTYKCLYCGNIQEVIEIKQDTQKQPEIKPTEPEKTESVKSEKTEKKFVDSEPLTNAIIRLIVCIFFGEFGIHRFMERKILSGIIYLFTFGLFGIGWLVDIVRYGINVANESIKYAQKQER